MEKSYREKDSQSEKVDYINELIAEAKKEKYQYQEEYDKLVRKPFFQKEVDNTNYKTMEELKEKLDTATRDTEKLRAKIVRLKKEENDLMREKREKEDDNDHYKKEVKRITQFMDPNGINPLVVAGKLRAEDPNAFRKLMHDIGFDGEDPDHDR